MVKKYVFRVGVFPPFGKVTVSALNEQEAMMKARGVLDKRAESKGEEPPVGWDLTLIKKRVVI